jgi:uncharacterized protein YlzI (FlbEa/FlbD family)
MRDESSWVPMRIKRVLRLKKHEIEKYYAFVDVLFKTINEETYVIDTSEDAIIRAIIQLTAEGKDVSKINQFYNDIVKCAEELNYIQRYTGCDIYSLPEHTFYKNGWYVNPNDSDYTGDIEIFETIVSYVVDPAHTGETKVIFSDGKHERIQVIKFGKKEDGTPFVDAF